MSLFTRDDPRYWEHGRPTDHNAVGLFIDGPQPAEPITNRLARLTESRCEATPEGPAGARQRMTRERQRRLVILDRQRSFVKAVLQGPSSGRPFVRRGAA